MKIDEAPDDDIFNTSYVEASVVSAESLSFSKSLNDIHAHNIPQNNLRPNSLAYKSDFFFYVSI